METCVFFEVGTEFLNLAKIKICSTIILQDVLCGYDTWSLVMREEHKLQLFEEKALRKMDKKAGLSEQFSIFRK
jgi:hypothetical protein